VAALVLAAGCGGSDGEQRTPRGPAPQPYPPRAAEPAASPPVRDRPPGRVVRVGPGPEGVVWDGASGRIAVGTRDPDRLVLVDGASLRVAGRVPLGSAPRHLQLAGGRVLVPSEATDELAVVDPSSLRSTVLRAGDNPHDATALAGAFFTADEFGSTVTRLAEGRRARTAPVDVQPGGIVALPDAIGVVSVRAYTFELLDPETLRGGGSQSAGAGPTHAVADGAGRVYVTDTRGDALSVFATRPRLKFVGRVPLPGSPYGIAVDEPRRRLLVTLTARNELVELSLGDRPRERRRRPTVRQPNTVAVDPASGRVIVASRTDGVLQIIDP